MRTAIEPPDAQYIEAQRQRQARDLYQRGVPYWPCGWVIPPYEPVTVVVDDGVQI